MAPRTPSAAPSRVSRKWPRSRLGERLLRRPFCHQTPMFRLISNELQREPIKLNALTMTKKEKFFKFFQEKIKINLIKY